MAEGMPILPSSTVKAGKIGKKLARIVNQRREAGDPLCTATTMMDKMQAHVGAMGGEVKFGHKREDGTFFQKDERDMARADFQMQLGQLAKIVAGLARKHAPRRINMVAGQGEAVDATEAYLAGAPGITGQYLES